jgi:deoxycytidylate deaminase
MNQRHNQRFFCGAFHVYVGIWESLQKNRKAERPSWDQYFMHVAEVVKSRSTCLSPAKGAVLVLGRQIISTGYNGTPAGTKHCDEGGCARCLAVKEGRMKSGTNLDACACLRGDTLLMGDNKPISDYEVGDTVVGMHHLNQVSQVFKRRYDGEMIRVEAKGILPLWLTPEHPLLVINADSRPNHRSPNLKLEWKLAGELRPRRNRPKYSKGDYLLLPRISGTSNIESLDLTPFAKIRLGHMITSFPLNSATAWLLGIYVAEGCSSRSQVSFTLHLKETNLAERIRETLASLGLPSSTGRKEGEESIFITCSSAILARAFTSWCGHLAPNKRIPDFILYHQRLDIVEAFLEGYSRGDGGWAASNAKNLEPDQLQISTTSQLLAMQVQLGYARLGRYAAIYNNKHEKETVIQGRRVHVNEAYTVRTSLKNTNIRVYERQDHLFFMLPVRSVSREHYEGFVYNLEAPTDNTFLVANIISHNCSHAEENAIVQAAKNGIRTSGCTLYSTHSPCTFCSKMIINADIRKVVVSNSYPDQLGTQLMREAGVELVVVKSEAGRHKNP